MKSIIKNSVLLLAALSLGSCNDWLDVNEDPNNPTNVAPELFISLVFSYTLNALHSTPTPPILFPPYL